MRTSWRQDGGVTRTASGPSPATSKPRRSSCWVIAGTSSAIPARRFSWSIRNRNAPGGSGTAPATIGALASPPHSSRISRVAYSVPGSTIAGSTPRSKRVRASLSMPSRRPVAAVRIGSNSATSSTTSTVSAVQPVLSPPMMPPRLMAPLSSAITVMPGSSV